METFLCVAICFALVALGLAVGVIINHSQKSTFENYFSAVLAEMMELNRRVENLSNDLIYAPDVSIYFWLVPIFLLKKTLKN